ncbi:major facilitator superfamily protein [Striga asiatica]|uniref:Major facilitator superfamily protein n=1 Tax=Striga asiatica TaxID=4170 RepID=A0A5A7P5Z7_STRAF|nr:major facilitator superfamily protein [Striga asiatica]
MTSEYILRQKNDDIAVSRILASSVIFCDFSKEFRKYRSKNPKKSFTHRKGRLSYTKCYLANVHLYLANGGVTSMAPFLKKFFPEVYARMKEDTRISNYCKFDSQLLTLFTSSLYLAGLISSFFSSFVNRAYGRKPTIIFGGAAFLAGAALNGAAVTIYMLIFGRVLLGVGVGFANQAVPLYLSEMAPPKYRGAFNNAFQLTVGIGALSANLINYGSEKIKSGWGWRLSLALAAVPASVLTLGAIFLPETPNSLIQRGHNPEKAKRTLQRARGMHDVQPELDDLIEASRSSKDSGNSYSKILRKNYRPQLVMSVAIPFFQQVTGINVIAFYAPILFRTIGFGESASLLSSVMTGVVGIFTTLLSMAVVDRFGRRFLLMSGGLTMLASQVAVGVLMGAELGDKGRLSRGDLCGGVWGVVGPTGMVDPERDFPTGDSGSGAERDGWGELLVHVLGRADVFVDVVPNEGRDLPIFRGVGGDYDVFRVSFAARDEERTDRANGEGCGAEFFGRGELLVHVLGGADVFVDAMQNEGRDLPVFQGVGGDYDVFHVFLAVGDEERADRADGEGVERALVLKKNCSC